MDLSIMPADVISIIGKFLLMGNNDTFKFNKLFRKIRFFFINDLKK
jgi:hypothetical protein